MAKNHKCVGCKKETDDAIEMKVYFCGKCAKKMAEQVK
jgi:ribosomal protein L37AE/L43A